MLLPLLKHFVLQFLQTEDEGKKDVDFDGVLAQDDLLELVEGELVHSEADEIGEDCEQGGVIFAISGR